MTTCDLWNAAGQQDGELCPAKGLILPFWSVYRLPVVTAGNVEASDNYTTFVVARNDPGGQGFPSTQKILLWISNMTKKGQFDWPVKLRGLGIRLLDKQLFRDNPDKLQEFLSHVMLEVDRNGTRYTLGRLWDFYMNPDLAIARSGGVTLGSDAYMQGGCPRGAQPIPPLDLALNESFMVRFVVEEPISVAASGPTTLDIEARILVEPIC